MLNVQVVWLVVLRLKSFAKTTRQYAMYKIKKVQSGTKTVYPSHYQTNRQKIKRVYPPKVSLLPTWKITNDSKTIIYTYILVKNGLS